MYGGTVSPPKTAARVHGLSPRVRGNPTRRRRPSGVTGSIPACTGEPAHETIAAIYCVGLSPRVRGTATHVAAMAVWLGLSPRVRGNPTVTHSPPGRYGSIPACTGEPARSLSRYPTPTVYPRVYGGTANLTLAMLPPKGLSPRVRGNRDDAGALRAGQGSIPACTGEPPGRSARSSTTSVYPRVYGEPAHDVPLTIAA